MDVRVGLWRRLTPEELMLLNCGVGEDFWESLGLQGDPTCPFCRRSALDFFGRNDAEAEAPVPWPPHEKSWLIGKDSDAGKDWGQEEKGMTEDEMDGWHHWLNGRESECTPGAGDGQGGLVCSDSWGRVESDPTAQLNWTELNQYLGLPRCLSGKESTCQCARCRFDLWVGKIPWRKIWELTSVFLPGKSHRQRSLVGYSPWGHRRIGHDLMTKTTTNISSAPVGTQRICKME